MVKEEGLPSSTHFLRAYCVPWPCQALPPDEALCEHGRQQADGRRESSPQSRLGLQGRVSWRTCPLTLTEVRGFYVGQRFLGGRGERAKA